MDKEPATNAALSSWNQLLLLVSTLYLVVAVAGARGGTLAVVRKAIGRRPALLAWAAGHAQARVGHVCNLRLVSATKT